MLGLIIIGLLIIDLIRFRYSFIDLLIGLFIHMRFSVFSFVPRSAQQYGVTGVDPGGGGVFYTF